MRNTPNRLRILARGLIRKTYLYGMIYGYFRNRFRIAVNCVLLESHHGADFIGSPRAIASYLASNDFYSHFTLVLVCPKSVGQQFIKAHGNNRVVTCRKGGVKYCFYLATCKWLINDVTFPQYFSIRHGQQYLNTWHGTPLKTLGRKTEKDTFLYVGNTQRNFFHATHILFPNHHTERVLIKDYMLSSVRKTQLLRCGYPRNDILYHTQNKTKTTKKYYIAFMPTWRGNFGNIQSAGDDFASDLKKALDYLEATVDENIKISVRLHPLAKGMVNVDGYNRIQPFPSDKEPYEHLAECDALITDYSSVMFDYAITKRPILLYSPDLDTYARERNFSLPLASLPFPMLKTPEDLSNWVNRIAQHESLQAPGSEPAYRSFINTYCSWDDGNNTERVCASFFEKKDSFERPALDGGGTKPKLLIYTGGLSHNGITASFKSLVKSVDTSKFDITILADTSCSTEESEAFFKNIPDMIQFIPLNLAISLKFIDIVRFSYLYMFEKNWFSKRDWIRRVWEREADRLFGHADFDLFVNFNGYSWRAAFLSGGLRCPSAIFVHNDMAKEIEANRIADLRLLEFSYGISTSVATVREGAESSYCASHYNFNEKCFYVPNTLSLSYSERANDKIKSAFSRNIKPSDRERIISSLDDPNSFRFINIARFSPEKGQLRLIEAFEKVCERHRNLQLYIVGGHGIDENKIKERTNHSAVSERIFVAQGSNNVMPLLKKMDTFVFSSFYEGIGLVLFESLALGVPIVSTNIPGPAELLSQGYGLVVDNSVEGLVEGMLAAIAEEVPYRNYDIKEHNRFALSQFEKLVTSSIWSKESNG